MLDRTETRKDRPEDTPTFQGSIQSILDNPFTLNLFSDLFCKKKTKSG